MYEVTIGIPVYNVEKYIRQTLDSALAQTFNDIEFLICDDCGTDSSMDIVKEYQIHHPRGKDIRVVRQPKNMGIGEARNRMMKEATGKFFYSLDADDIIKEDAISLLYNAAMKYNAEIVYGSYERLFDNGTNKRTVPYEYPFRVFTKPDEYAEYVYNIGIQVMNWNYLILLDIIRKNNLKVTPVGHGYGEDFTFTVDLPTYITRAVLLPNITYQYYIEETVFKNKRKKLMSRIQMDESIKAIDIKKHRTELKTKSYYPKRCSLLLMYDFSFVCQILARRDEANPKYSNKEIHKIMSHPMALSEILHSKQVRLKNLGFYCLWKLPTCLSVPLMTIIARLSKRI